jgi:hypothetical protein
MYAAVLCGMWEASMLIIAQSFNAAAAWYHMCLDLVLWFALWKVWPAARMMLAVQGFLRRANDVPGLQQLSAAGSNCNMMLPQYLSVLVQDANC